MNFIKKTPNSLLKELRESLPRRRWNDLYSQITFIESPFGRQYFRMIGKVREFLRTRHKKYERSGNGY